MNSVMGSLEEAASSRIGQVLRATWRLERLLGVGGMAAVYEGRHCRNDGCHAVKVLHPEMSEREDVRMRFLREARAANAVKHPGVVRVYDDRVKLLDFGIARVNDAVPSSLKTRMGTALGTAPYMAPEQALGKLSEVDG